MKDESLVDLNRFCYEFEASYYKDKDIISILQMGATPQNLLNASKLIRNKEKSRFLKFPVNLTTQEMVREKANIEDLPKIAEAIYTSEELKSTLESIELAGNEDIVLKVLGPFSSLLERIDSNTLFKWLYKHKNEMHSALEKIMEDLADYINTAIDKGANIISIAEPSAMVEVIGEVCYKEFVILYMVKLLKEIEANMNKSIVHICPRSSIYLERYGFAAIEELLYSSNSYGQALIDLAKNKDIKFIGHRCINAEDAKVDKIYVLRLK